MPMAMLCLLIISAFILVTLLGVMMMVISTKQTLSSNKLSPFECGFSPWENSRQSFSLQFFMLSVVFLIFDVEIVILFPVLYLFYTYSTSTSLIVVFLFMAFLLLSLFIEWFFNKLEWCL